MSFLCFYYAGAKGLSFPDTAEMNTDLDIDSEVAYEAWKKGSELRQESLSEKQNSTLKIADDYDTINLKNTSIKGDGENGDVAGRDINKNDNGYSELQRRTEANGIYSGMLGLGDKNSSTAQSIARGSGKTEKRTLEALVEDDKFIKLHKFVGNEISGTKFDELYAAGDVPVLSSFAPI